MDYVSFDLPVSPDDCSHTVFVGESVRNGVVVLTEGALDFTQESFDLQCSLHSSFSKALYDFSQENRSLDRDELSAVLYFFCERGFKKT